MMITSILVLATVESASIRLDTRTAESDGRIATAIEAVGEADGSMTSEWTTNNKIYDGSAEYPDGWYVRDANRDWVPETEENAQTNKDVLVLNVRKVVGGKLTEETTWDTNDTFVVRHNVVVPTGISLVIEPETEVAFTESARIVQKGGTVRVRGAYLKDGFAGNAQDWFAGRAEGSWTRLMMLDGNDEVAPLRTYTEGEVYGTLPTFDKYEDGWWFRGWKTTLDGEVSIDETAAVDMTLTALYCNWELIFVEPSTTLVEIPAYSVGVQKTVAVSSNDKWIWTKSDGADWLTVTDAGTVSNGVLTLTAAQNRSEKPRSAVVTVSRANGKLSREISVTQLAMEHVATPKITTGSGETTFTDYMESIWITCATKGASIYYTTDGSEPSATESAKLTTYDYEGGIAGVLNVYATTTIKAIAVKDDLLDSSVSSLGVVRADTLADAMDIPDQYVTTSGDKLWEVTTSNASDNVSCVRSGAMTTANRRQRSNLEMVVEGSGTLTFKWKVDCERDLTGSKNWDYLAFVCDGSVFKKIDGDQGWETVTVTLTGNNYHILTWIYTKNAAKLDINPGADCAWIDQVKWTPALFVGEGEDAHELVVDNTLLSSLGLVGASDDQIVTAAAADADGDGFSNEQEIILGTNPYDANDKFQIKIDSLDAENGLAVSMSPVNNQNQNYEMHYKTLGAKELGTGFDDVTNLSTAERAAQGYRFFKATVNWTKK